MNTERRETLKRDRYTENQMKRLFDFTDDDLRDIRNGDVDFGFCEVCGLYFDSLIGELALVENAPNFIDRYCAKRLPAVPSWMSR